MIIHPLGADPNGTIEWKLSNFFRKWTPREWSSKHQWLSAHCYPSHLDFALTTSKGKPFSE